MKVIPAILEQSPSVLFSQIKRLAPYFKTFQIDIADGIFVPNKTLRIENLIDFLTNNHYLITNNFIFDFHLMVNDYEKEIQKLEYLKKLLKIDNVFIHYSLFPKYKFLSEKYSEFQIGLVLNTQDSVESFVKLYPATNLPLIQIMTIDLGYQGLEFKPEMLQKIERLRQLGYRSKIYIDGGVNDNTLPFILAQEYRPDALVIGSFLIRAQNLKERVDYLKEKVK